MLVGPETILEGVREVLALTISARYSFSILNLFEVAVVSYEPDQQFFPVVSAALNGYPLRDGVVGKEMELSVSAGTCSF